MSRDERARTEPAQRVRAGAEFTAPFQATGKAIARARKYLSWSQEVLAEKSGFSVRLVQKAEAGHRVERETHKILIQTLKGSWRVPQNFPVIPFPDGSPCDTSAPRPTVAPLSNPHQLAMLEALRLIAPASQKAKLRMGKIRTEAELLNLWTIDNEAYGDGNITFDHFLALWNAFPAGLHVLFHENEIMGAMGLWPVTSAWAEQIKSAQLKEAELDPHAVCEAGSRAACRWYITGLMLRAELIGAGGAVKTLLNGALGAWVNELQVDYPCEILALAYSNEGERLLRRFGFHIAQHASRMPDNCPLYRLAADSKGELAALFRSRNLTLKLA